MSILLVILAICFIFLFTVFLVVNEIEFCLENILMVIGMVFLFMSILNVAPQVKESQIIKDYNSGKFKIEVKTSSIDGKVVNADTTYIRK